MTGMDLPDNNHVVRYVSPRHVRKDGKVTRSAFSLRPHRPDDTGLSVNWLEYFCDCTKDEQLAEVRRLSRLKMRIGGRLAELNVGKTKQYLQSELHELRFIHKPLIAKDGYEADPSHSEITGLPKGNSPEAELVGDMIAQSVTDVRPAVLRQPKDI